MKSDPDLENHAPQGAPSSRFGRRLESNLGARDADIEDEVLSWRMDPMPPPPPGPDRATLWVPSEETLLNVGEHFPGPSPTRIDSGITGRTASHTHLHVMGAENGVDDPVRTLVREGVPVEKDSVAYVYSGKSDEEKELEEKFEQAAGEEMVEELWPGKPSESPREQELERVRKDYARRLRQVREARARASEGRDSIGTVFPQAHDRWNGYSMLTRGGAVHESRFNQVVVSGEGDLRAVGQRSVSIGSPGDVIVAVQQGVDVAEFCRNIANQSSPEEPGPGKMHREVAQIISGVSTMIFSGLTSAYQIANLANGYNKSPFENKTGWDAPTPAEYTFTELQGGALASLGPVFVGVGPLLDTPGGRLDLFSTGTASLVGMTTAKLYGLWFNSIGSLGVVSVSAGSALALGSNLNASLGAPMVSVNAIGKLSIECQLGALTQRSRKKMEISSQDRMWIASEQDMQLTAMQGRATIYARSGALLAAGGGVENSPNSRYRDVTFAKEPGFGVHATATDLFLGRFDPVNEHFSSPMRDKEVNIDVWSDAIDLTMHQTKMRLKQDRIEIATDVYEVNARKEAKINGKRVLLG